MKKYDLNTWTVGFLVFLALFFGVFLFYPVGSMLKGAVMERRTTVTQEELQKRAETFSAAAEAYLSATESAGGISDTTRSRAFLAKVEELTKNSERLAEQPDELHRGIVVLRREASGLGIEAPEVGTALAALESAVSLGFTTKFFRLILESPLQREAILTSLFIAGMTTLLATCLTLPLAHVMTRYRFAGRSLLGGLLLVPMIMPPFVGALGLKQLFARYGSVNLWLMDLGLMPADAPVDWFGDGGVWGVILLQVLGLYPILFLNVSAAMANLDPSLRESAQNLGASGWRLFRTVTLPLILPGCFAGAVIVFIWSFTDLGTPLIFGLQRVVPVQIFDSINDLNTNPMGYALVVFVLVLVLTLFLLSKKLFAGKRHEMIARGHVAAAESEVGWRGALLIWGFVGGVILVALLPHFAVIVQSFADRWFFSILPDGWTTRHYGDVFGHSLTASSIRNSLFYSSLSAMLDLVLGVIIAWLLTRRRIPAAGLLDALAMLPLAIPGLVIAFGYVAAFDFEISWLNPRENPTLLLVISYAVRRLPYIVRSAYAGFQQTSVTLEEASANLGASPLRTLRKITLPLVMANLIAGTILTFSFAMLEVSDGLILAMNSDYFPITRMIYQLIGRLEPTAPAVACALGVVGMAILTVSLLLAGRLLGKKMGQLFRA